MEFKDVKSVKDYEKYCHNEARKIFGELCSEFDGDILKQLAERKNLLVERIAHVLEINIYQASRDREMEKLYLIEQKKEKNNH